MGGRVLEETTEEKALGVMIHKSLKPGAQVAKAAKNGQSSAGRDCQSFIKLYQVYVLCHLEYVVQSWSPYLQQDINILEAVQQRAVRMISGMTGTYEGKLSQVGLTTLHPGSD